MKTTVNQTLEFDIILEKLSNFAVSQRAKEKLLLLSPFLKEALCKTKMAETSEAKKILESLGTPPLASMKELDSILELTERGAMLVPEQLRAVSEFLSACRRMKGYLKKAVIYDLSLASYGDSFIILDPLYEEIERSIRNDSVDDTASPTLRDLRRKLENTASAIKEKLEGLLRSKKEWFADGYVVTRNGRLVLPVKKEYKSQVPGTVIEYSNTGSTCFIEPSAVRKLQEERANLQIEEDNEVRRILYTLTALVGESITELKINMDCMEILDFAFAKAKLSMEMKGIEVPLSTNRTLKIVQGRHPLLKQDCVPLDFEFGGSAGIVITGPNTGGKTVVLKTVGLLSLMAQSGLHVPVSEGSVFCMHDHIRCDIGDGQSITENLSTFSSHITNIIEILKNVTPESLVLLDELGSGTDPAEGMGLAVSILEELRERGCLFLATTHYPEIKEYAKNTQGLSNARMTFDRESLKPLYRLEIGEAGESCALYIAKRLGFPEHLLSLAYQEAYGKRRNGHKTQREEGQEGEERQEFLSSQPDSPRATPVFISKIQREEAQKAPSRSAQFNIGDSVKVYPQKVVGIIYKRANEKGELGVQIQKKKQLINHKRIKLISPAEELYPDDYDFSIIFDSVEQRKARHQMDRKHNPELLIHYEEE